MRADDDHVRLELIGLSQDKLRRWALDQQPRGLDPGFPGRRRGFLDQAMFLPIFVGRLFAVAPRAGAIAFECRFWRGHMDQPELRAERRGHTPGDLEDLPGLREKVDRYQDIHSELVNLPHWLQN